MNAEKTRLLLLAQHERLREHVQTCTRLAELFRVGESTRKELDITLAAGSGWRADGTRWVRR